MFHAGEYLKMMTEQIPEESIEKVYKFRKATEKTSSEDL